MLLFELFILWPVWEPSSVVRRRGSACVASLVLFAERGTALTRLARPVRAIAAVDSTAAIAPRPIALAGLRDAIRVQSYACANVGSFHRWTSPEQ